jgi:hypothetical protein
MPATPLSPATTPYYGGGQVATPANVLYGIVSPPSNNAATGGGLIYINTLNGDVYISYKPGAWSVAASATGSVSTLTGNSGGAIAPVGGNINIVGAGGTLVSGAGSTLTITAAPQTFTWNNNATSTAMAVNNGYIVTNAAQQTFTLPAVSAVGDEIALMGVGLTGSWRVQRVAAESLRVEANLSSGAVVSGWIQTTGVGQTIWMTCVVASAANNGTWQALAYAGALDVQN